MSGTDKTYDAKHQIWMVKDVDGGVVRIGFTPEFLPKLAECWHIMPPGGGLIRENDPLICLETNDELISIRSPLSGVMAAFNEKAMNFPDKITEDDEIIVVKPQTKGEIAKPTPVRGNNARLIGGEEPVFRPGIDWGAAAQQAGVNVQGDRLPQWENPAGDRLREELARVQQLQAERQAMMRAAIARPVAPDPAGRPAVAPQQPVRNAGNTLNTRLPRRPR